jgi:hypothetical protein
MNMEPERQQTNRKILISLLILSCLALIVIVRAVMLPLYYYPKYAAFYPSSFLPIEVKRTFKATLEKTLRATVLKGASLKECLAVVASVKEEKVIYTKQLEGEYRDVPANPVLFLVLAAAGLEQGWFDFGTGKIIGRSPMEHFLRAAALNVDVWAEARKSWPKEVMKEYFVAFGLQDDGYQLTPPYDLNNPFEWQDFWEGTGNNALTPLQVVRVAYILANRGSLGNHRIILPKTAHGLLTFLEGISRQTPDEACGLGQYHSWAFSFSAPRSAGEDCQDLVRLGMVNLESGRDDLIILVRTKSCTGAAREDSQINKDVYRKVVLETLRFFEKPASQKKN